MESIAMCQCGLDETYRYTILTLVSSLLLNSKFIVFRYTGIAKFLLQQQQLFDPDLLGEG